MYVQAILKLKNRSRARTTYMGKEDEHDEEKQYSLSFLLQSPKTQFK